MDFEKPVYEPTFQTLDMSVGDWGREVDIPLFQEVLDTEIDWSQATPILVYDSRARYRHSRSVIVQEGVSGGQRTVSILANGPLVHGAAPTALVALMRSSGTISSSTLNYTQRGESEVNLINSTTKLGWRVHQTTATIASPVVSCSLTVPQTATWTVLLGMFRLGSFHNKTFHAAMRRSVDRFREPALSYRSRTHYELVSDGEWILRNREGRRGLLWGIEEPFAGSFETNLFSDYPCYGLFLEWRDKPMQTIHLKNMTIEVQTLNIYGGSYPAGGFPLRTGLGPEWRVVNVQIQPMDGNATRFYRVDLANRRVRVYVTNNQGLLTETATNSNVTAEPVTQIVTAIPVSV